MSLHAWIAAAPSGTGRVWSYPFQCSVCGARVVVKEDPEKLRGLGLDSPGPPDGVGLDSYGVSWDCEMEQVRQVLES